MNHHIEVNQTASLKPTSQLTSTLHQLQLHSKKQKNQTIILHKNSSNPNPETSTLKKGLLHSLEELDNNNNNPPVSCYHISTAPDAGEYDYETNINPREPSFPYNILELPSGVSENELFTMRDIDTGEIFDLREREVQKMMIPQSKVDVKGSHWVEFWKKVRRNNECLWDAAEGGDLEKVKAILEGKKNAFPVEINSTALDDWTALHMSVNKRYFDIVKYLVEKGADIEARSQMRRTPLHFACSKGYLEIVEYLVSAGDANINAEDEDGNTPLHSASEHGHSAIVDYLIEQNGTMVGKKNIYGLTCVDVAGNLEVRRVFEAKGLVNKSTVNSYGRMVLDDDVILYNGRVDIVGKILAMQDYHSRRHQWERIMLMKKLKKEDTHKQKQQVNKVTPAPQDGRQIDYRPNNRTDNKVTLQSFMRHNILGKGSFGEVFLVEKINDKKLYAMKILRKERILQYNFLRYAMTENKVLGEMDHPFIIKLYYAFQTQTKLFLILQYCPGGDLRDLILRRSRLGEDLARIYAAEIILALEALHERDIIYRDLKPENVVLDREGHVLLADFGLAKEGINENLTKSFCGSLSHLAPEVINRSGHNKTVDWYLLGVLIHEMLVGIPPYFSRDKEQIIKNIQKGNLTLSGSLSNDVKDLLLGLLKRNPKKRLGAKKGAEEIKSHPWFQGINWEDVLARKLRTPPPRTNFPKLNQLINMNIEIDPELPNGRNHVEGWSFIRPE